MTEHNLTLRLIGLSDYRVVRNGRAIGRIRIADERPDQERWDWHLNAPLPIPSWCRGSAASLEEAKTALRAAWTQLFETLTPNDIKLWHSVQDGPHERAERRGWS
jgi:hypothetical protein